jgi:MinD-like ATPase involved in chromosome partitioning or flagellar assembly
VVTEGVKNTLRHTKLLVNDIASLQIDLKSISIILNNRVRSEVTTPLNQAQERLGHSILSVITPAPELFMQAVQKQTMAVISQPTNATTQQFLKIADAILEREKA